jgi:S-DNA-T family DNA segregation ATPase FtsK/SpoIIIE
MCAKNADFEELSGEDLKTEKLETPDFQLDLNLDEEEIDDELYEEAKDLIIKTGKASSSYLQRRFRIGYARAARLLDILEERGVVGPGEGAKPREVLIKDAEKEKEEYKEEITDNDY